MFHNWDIASSKFLYIACTIGEHFRGNPLFVRREILLSIACGMAVFLAPAPAVAKDSTTAVRNLKAFMLETVGRPTEERLAKAKSTLAALKPMEDETLLVEIAAIGVIVRGSPTSIALREGYPNRSRKTLDYAMKTMSNASWVVALDGAWHFEVIRRSKVGALFYGASRDKGEARFARAETLDPTDAGIRLAHVVALLSSGSQANAAPALEILRKLPKGDATPYGKLVQTQAVGLIKLLAAGQVAAASNQALMIF